MLTANRATAPARRSFSSISFGSTGRIAIALSGGGDSTALACIAHDILAERGEADRLIAITVDHGLRAESAREAERAGAFCARLGIDHTLTHWRDDKPTGALQAAAREARYRLLGDAAETAGARIVLTGHTLDDQAETVAMRRERGAGRGLSGIAPATLHARRTWFVRPLLATGRAELRAHLAARGQGWIDDPSNEDPRFERVRMRRRLGAQTPDPEIFRAAHTARMAQASMAAALIADDTIWTFDAEARTAELADRGAAARDGFALALAIVLGWTGHAAYLPSGALLAKAADFCANAAAGRKITVAGCLLDLRGGRVRIGREARNGRRAGFGFDHLLPSPDFEAAEALALRVGAPRFPPPPLSGYPD